MNGSEFKHRLRVMGRTQSGFASEVGVTERTVHNWASRGPPAEIGYLLDTLTALEMPFGPPVDLVGDASAAAAFERSTTKIMDQLADRAAREGAGQAFIDAVRLWVNRATDQVKTITMD